MFKRIYILFLFLLLILFQVNLYANIKIEKQVSILLEESGEKLDYDANAALDLALYALQLSDSIKNEKLRGLSNKYVGISYIKLYQHKNAIPFLKNAAELLKNYELPRDKILIYHNLGRAYREEDSYLLAEKALWDCIELASSTGDLIIEGRSYYMLAKVYRKKSDYVSGLDVCFKCLEIASELQDSLLMSGCENEVGIVYHKQNKKDDALKYYFQALDKKMNINDSSGIADIYQNIGNVYRKEGQNLLAIEKYDMAMRYLPKIEHQPNNFYLPYNLGIAYYNLERFDDAKSYFTKSLEEANKQNSQSKRADAYIWLARVLIEEDRFTDSESYLDKALTTALEIESLDIERMVYFVQYKLNEKQKRYAEALDYHKKYAGLTREIFNEETDKVATEMRLVYESERQEKRIVELQNQLLTQDNEKTNLEKSRNALIFFAFVLILITASILVYVLQRRKRNKLLTAKNKELEEVILKLEESINSKDKIFTIIAHDLKSPFNSIMGFAELLLAKSENISKDKLIKYSSQIHKSAQTTYELLKNLLDWARLQLGQINVNKQLVNLKKLVEVEIDYCKGVAAKKNVQLESSIDPDLQFSADSSMLSIVLRNLLTNAIKFSPSNTRVFVQSQQENGHVNITVSDAGVGIPTEKMNKLFSFQTNTSTLGTNGEKGTGLGLVLSHEFIKLQNGRIDVRSKPGKTDFTISLPFNSH